MSKQVPRLEPSTKFHFVTSIWMLPIVALLISGWLAYEYFSQLGPEIRIIFPKNEGLKVGQSAIKYKDVSIGIVKKVELQEDGEGVTVVARMDKSATNYLNENTKFWIVKPEVGLSGVSGLETLITGTYINMYTQQGHEFIDKFHGLHQAYRKVNEGEYFHLNAPIGYSIKKGTPLYFKNMKVGYVEYINIALDGQSIDFIVFINKLYLPYLHTDSKFWVTSAITMDIDNGKLNVNMAPITHLLHGGIAFSSTGEDKEDNVSSDHIFHLYANYDLAKKKLTKETNYPQMIEIETNQSVAKLTENASVQYEGYDVGSVKNIVLRYDDITHKINAKIYAEIDISFFAQVGERKESIKRHFTKAVREGLSAQISSNNFLTGHMIVSLVFEKDRKKAYALRIHDEHIILPTIVSHDANLMDKVEKMVEKLNELPMDKLFASLNKLLEQGGKVLVDTDKIINHVDKPLMRVMKDMKQAISNLNKMTNKKAFTQMPEKVNKSLDSLNRTLKATRKVVKGYDNNSLLTRQIAETLKVVTQTSREMQQFLKMLNRKPNSLIFGDQ